MVKKDHVKRKLTKTQAKRNILFKEIRRKLLEKGYTDKNVVISALKANVMSILIVLPLVVVLNIIYSAFHPDYIPFEYTSSFYIFLFVGVIVHELIHGIAWARFTKKKWKSIGFGIIWKYLTPYCTCNEALKYREYVIGVIAPTFILGIIPYITSVVTGSHSILMFSFFHLICGGGDLCILYLLKEHKNTIVLDHPYLIGCAVFDEK